VVLVLFLLSGPAMIAQNKAIDPGGWTKAKWGMTEAQVKTAFPGAKRIIDYGDPLLGLEHYEIGPIKYRVTFYFDKKGGGLTGVALEAENGDATPGVYAEAAKGALLSALRDKYGEPTSTQVQPPSPIGVKREWRWLMPQTGITLSYMDAPDRQYRFALLVYSKRKKQDQL